MKVENIESWPIDISLPLWKAKFRLVRAEEPTMENLDEWFKTGDSHKSTVVLFANPTTLKKLDTQVPTTEITYRQYILMMGIVNKILEDWDGLTEDGDAYLFSLGVVSHG